MPATLELLAPARNAEIGIEAVKHGADAVYIGGPEFGARHGAGNSVADIERLAAYAHRFHAKLFITLNTIFRDEEIEDARRLAWQMYEAGADALIVQDMGLLELDLPPIQLHASTQCDIRTPAKARFLADAGFSQMVLARELSLPDILAIRDQKSATAMRPDLRRSSNSSSTAPSAWPSPGSATSATPTPDAAPTAANARRPAACPTRWKTARAASSPSTSTCCR
jgi:collagenase-like PrtC family protease